MKLVGADEVDEQDGDEHQHQNCWVPGADVSQGVKWFSHIYGCRQPASGWCVAEHDIRFLVVSLGFMMRKHITGPRVSATTVESTHNDGHGELAVAVRWYLPRSWPGRIPQPVPSEVAMMAPVSPSIAFFVAPYRETGVLLPWCSTFSTTTMASRSPQYRCRQSRPSKVSMFSE